MDFAYRLNRILEYSQLTKKEFVDKCKTNTTQLFYYLKGEQEPNAKFLRNLIKAFPKTNLNWLITGTGSMLIDNIKEEIETKIKTVEKIDTISLEKDMEEMKGIMKQLSYDNNVLKNNIANLIKYIKETNK